MTSVGNVLSKPLSGSMRRSAPIAATIAVGLFLVTIGFSVFVPAWEHLRFWTWCYSNRMPCALFPLDYRILGLNFSTANSLAAQALLNLGLGVAVLGFALIFLTFNKTLTRSEQL